MLADAARADTSWKNLSLPHPVSAHRPVRRSIAAPENLGVEVDDALEITEKVEI
jgi:hypothetical protein